MSTRVGGGNRNISDLAKRLGQDGQIDKADAEKLLTEAGTSINRNEEKQLKDVLGDRSLVKSGDATALLQSTIKDLGQYRAYASQRNQMVAARAGSLESQEKARLEPGRATTTLGGTAIPEDVKKIVNAAKAAGALAYDVSELSDNPVKDDHGEGYTITGKWTPYPQDIEAGGSMAFAHTEVTPEKLKKDMEEVTTYTRIKGYKSETQRDMRTGESRTFEVAEYEKVTGKGTGNITSHYDEASHPDTFARGTSNQKWANNYAILADGSLHCLPAARRTQSQPGLILTNPSLARGQRMLANGHIEVRNGVVTSIGISGRVQKLAAEGDAKFIDPVAVLKAWGFKIAPGVRVQFEGSGPAPKVDPNTNVIG